MKAEESEQYQLFETSQYKYRMFITDFKEVGGPSTASSSSMGLPRIEGIRIRRRADGHELCAQV